MECNAQLWNDLLYTSGGCLELPKTSYQILQFKFSPNGAPRVVTGVTEDPILLKDPSSDQIFSIAEIPANQAHKTLGHHKSPADTKQRQQLSSLAQKAHHLSVLINTGAQSQRSLDYFVSQYPGPSGKPGLASLF